MVFTNKLFLQYRQNISSGRVKWLRGP